MSVLQATDGSERDQQHDAVTGVMLHNPAVAGEDASTPTLHCRSFRFVCVGSRAPCVRMWTRMTARLMGEPMPASGNLSPASLMHVCS